MFCRFCGKSIEGDSVFCPYCGKRLEEKAVKPEKMVSQPTMTDTTFNTRDDAYYLSQASKIAGSTLISITKIICYVALAIFLFLNIKMAPSHGIIKNIIYVITAAIAIGLVVLFNKKVFAGKSKVKFKSVLIASVIVIVASVGLRIVYETKVDSVTAQFPTSGSVKVTMTTHTDYYNDTGTGSIRNPSTNIRIGEKWYDSGDVIEVALNQKYSMRVGAGGSGSGGYIDTSITFTNSSFKSGQYTVIEEVRITSGPASMAEVQLTFKRYCTFWEVIFG